ncbi:MAG: nucleotidyltransferase family protein [Chloroflexi bacterium]|nr:nucleotidyltransferase family protein [Chloroflexota bacterium]
MDAIVTAGGIPMPDEPLYPYTQGASKALVDVAGRPMIQWSLDALSGAKKVENVIIIGLDESHGLKCAKPLAYVPNHGGMVDNIRAGTKRVMELNPAASHVLIVSSDIPTITAEMVDWTVTTCLETDDDMYYNVVERSVMEKRFPGSNRTYTKLKGIQVCGGDMNVIKPWVVLSERGLWKKLEASRKNALKQASLVGFDTLLLILFRLVDLKGAEKQASKRLGLKARVVECPYAEIGMDVDKPNQLELLRADLAR